MRREVLTQSRSQRPATRGADNKWLHDKAPAAPTNGASKPVPAAAVNNKIAVSNLHYEITPKDLAVCFQQFSRSSRTLTLYFSQAIFGQIGTLVREPLIRVRPTPNFT